MTSPDRAGMHRCRELGGFWGRRLFGCDITKGLLTTFCLPPPSPRGLKTPFSSQKVTSDPSEGQHRDHNHATCPYGMPEPRRVNCEESNFRIRYWKTIFTITDHSYCNYLRDITKDYMFHSNYTIDLTAWKHCETLTATFSGPLGIVSPHASDRETETSEEVTKPVGATLLIPITNVGIYHANVILTR